MAQVTIGNILAIVSDNQLGSGFYTGVFCFVLFFRAGGGGGVSRLSASFQEIMDRCP